MSEITTAVANACSKCGNAIESLSADPGMWAVWISLPGDNGETKPYHAKCILPQDDELDRLRAENARLVHQVECQARSITMLEDAVGKDLCVVEAVNEIKRIRAENARLVKEKMDDKDYIESLCKELCTMEDALGFKHDCHDKDGAWVPTIGPWLERLRDLISKEGELGDYKSALEKAREALGNLNKPLYSQGASQNEIVNKIQMRDKQIAEALAAINEVLK